MKLRNYQQEAKNAVYQALREREDNPCVVIPTAGGKSPLMASICKDAVELWGGRVLILAHVKELLQQLANHLNEMLEWNKVGIYSAGLKQRETTQPVIVAGIQSVYRRAKELGRFNLIIVDECFPEGTEVLTTSGHKKIELVRCGDKVYNAAGIGTVTSVSARSAHETIKIEFESGKIVECTPNHKFFTKFGWKKAKDLDLREIIFGVKTVRILWKQVLASKVQETSMGDCGIKLEHKGKILLTSMSSRRKTKTKATKANTNYMGNDKAPTNKDMFNVWWNIPASKNMQEEGLVETKVLFDVLREEITEPNVRSSGKEESKQAIKRDRSQTYAARWEWAHNALATAEAIKSSGEWVGSGSCNSNKKEKKDRVSDLLQGGHCKQEKDDRDRSRRPNTQFNKKKRTRREENETSCFFRVVNISSVKRKSPISVYNLSVSGHPSYFVNGILVHNCHRLRPNSEGMYRTFLKDTQPGARLIGLTATPFRMGSGLICKPENLLNHICYEISVKELVVQGYLSKLTVKSTKDVQDMSGLHVRAGEFIEKETDNLLNQVDVVNQACDEIIERTQDRNAILIFCCSVGHGKRVIDVLQGKGQDAKGIFGNTHSDLRDERIQDFKNGKLKYLINCQVLTLGFDAPNIDCVVLMRPTLSPGLYYQMCLDDKTEILTKDGWKTYKSIKKSDKIAAVNKEYEIPQLSWETPEEIIIRDRASYEKMVSIQSHSVDIRVTDYHDMIVTGIRSEEGWKKEAAWKVAHRKDGYCIPTAAMFDPKGLNLSDDEVKFLGWFMTDGNLNKRTNAIAIAQSEIQPHFHEVEKMLQGCGFKYGKHRIKNQVGSYKESAPRWIFTVSKGMPRGRDKHLRGWRDLEKYIGKDLPETLFDLSVKQYEILIEAIHLGDGSKQINQSWTRRSYHISTVNKVFADRLQSLSLQRGHRCNVVIQRHNEKPLYLLHIKKQHYRTLGGWNQKDRSCLQIESSYKKEKVWCVRVNSGAFIARRNGKAFITGNCGRGFRLHKSKSETLILDYGGNVLRHGPVDIIRINDDGIYGDGSGKAPAKTCPQCLSIIHAAYANCPDCGYKFAKEDESKHGGKAGKHGILSGEPINTEYKVFEVRYSIHTKHGASSDHPQTMRVEYKIGWKLYQSEWVCFDHDGYARRKAEAWWRKRSDDYIPESVGEAVDRAENGALCDTEMITIRYIPGEKYERIVDYKLSELDVIF